MDNPDKATETNDQKGTDEPWKLPGQSSQDPKQTPPPKPDYANPERRREREQAETMFALMHQRM